jgi:hypothetical protein
MPKTPQSAKGDDDQFQRDIDEVFSRANPNPDRVGCPPRETLVRLARRQQPLADPAYEHLAKCSPCFQQFRALQEEFARTAAVRPGGRRWLLGGVAAGIVLALGAGWWFTGRQDPSPVTQTTSVAPDAQLRAEVDLRRFTVLRSEQAQGDAEPVALPRGSADLVILLPVGSEPGAYDVQLLDGDLRSRSDAKGTAAIEDFVTTLHVRMDLRQLAAGRYQLAVRREGDSWRMFPAVVE